MENHEWNIIQPRSSARGLGFLLSFFNILLPESSGNYRSAFSVLISNKTVSVPGQGRDIVNSSHFSRLIHLPSY